MKWVKPEAGENSYRWYVTSECGLWRICKAHVGERIVYTLSHRGELVVSGDLELCKERAEKGDER